MEEKDNNNPNFFRAQNVLTFLGIFAPAPYLVGISYYQGSMSAYGINSSSFPLLISNIKVSSNPNFNTL